MSKAKKAAAPVAQAVVEPSKGWNPLEDLYDFLTGDIFDVPAPKISEPISDESEDDGSEAKAGSASQPIINVNLGNLFKRAKQPGAADTTAKEAGAASGEPKPQE